MKSLTSDKNPVFRQWRDLLESRGIKKHGAFLVAGRKTVPEILKAHPDRILTVIYGPKHSELKGSKSMDSYQLSSALFKELDDSGTDYPLLVVTTAEMREADLTQPPTRPSLLCALGDPGNVGALVRVALAFGVEEIILLEEAASPFHPKAVRGASGAMMEMDFSYGPSIKQLTTSTEFHEGLIVLDQNGEDIGTFKWPKNFRLLIGEEGPGVGATGFKQTVSIPINRSVESLNAVSAASVALYLSSKNTVKHH